MKVKPLQRAQKGKKPVEVEWQQPRRSTREPVIDLRALADMLLWELGLTNARALGEVLD